MNRDCQAYSLYIDLIDAVDYRFNAYEEIDYWDDFLANNFIGKPLPADWAFPRHEVGNKKGVLNDFVQGYTHAPFVSRRAMIALQPLLSKEVEFRSIGTILGCDYYVLNVINIINCLNETKSELVRSDDGRVLSVCQAVFIEDGFSDSNIFKVPQDTGIIFVSQCVVDCVRDNQLTGVGFEFPDRRGLISYNAAFADLPMR